MPKKVSLIGPSKDDFDHWLANPPAPQTKCSTCKCSPEVQADIVRYVEAARTRPEVPTIRALWKYLTEKYQYKPSYDVLNKHINRCLGYQSRG